MTLTTASKLQTLVEYNTIKYRLQIDKSITQFPSALAQILQCVDSIDNDERRCKDMFMLEYYDEVFGEFAILNQSSWVCLIGDTTNKVRVKLTRRAAPFLTKSSTQAQQQQLLNDNVEQRVILHQQQSSNSSDQVKTRAENHVANTLAHPNCIHQNIRVPPNPISTLTQQIPVSRMLVPGTTMIRTATTTVTNPVPPVISSNLRIYPMQMYNAISHQQQQQLQLQQQQNSITTSTTIIHTESAEGADQKEQKSHTMIPEEPRTPTTPVRSTSTCPPPETSQISVSDNVFSAPTTPIKTDILHTPQRRRRKSIQSPGVPLAVTPMVKATPKSNIKQETPSIGKKRQLSTSLSEQQQSQPPKKVVRFNLNSHLTTINVVPVTSDDPLFSVNSTPGSEKRPRFKLIEKSSLLSYATVLLDDFNDTVQDIRIDGCRYILMKDGTVYQIDGSTISKCLFPSEMIQIASSSTHTLFLSKDHKIYGIGSNLRKQLDPKSDIISYDHITYLDTHSHLSITHIGCGDGFSVFGNNQFLYTYGGNSKGQLGSKETTDTCHMITLPSGPSKQLTKIVCAATFTIYIHDGIAHLFGRISTNNLNKIIQYNVSDVTCGDEFALLLASDSHVYGIGSNESKAIGINQKIAVVARSNGLRHVMQVSAGPDFALFMKQDMLFVCGSSLARLLDYDDNSEGMEPQLWDWKSMEIRGKNNKTIDTRMMKLKQVFASGTNIFLVVEEQEEE